MKRLSTRAFYYLNGERAPVHCIPVADPHDVPAGHIKIHKDWWHVQSGTVVANQYELEQLRFNLLPEMKEWCEANLSRYPDLVNFHATIDGKSVMEFCLRFHTERDFILFKLFWI